LLKGETMTNIITKQVQTYIKNASIKKLNSNT
jgi:hypothetical protein